MKGNNLISNIIKLISISGILAITLGAFYNLAFYAVVDIAYFNLLTLDDFLSTAILIMPVVFVFIGITLYWDTPWKSSNSIIQQFSPQNSWLLKSTWERNLESCLIAGFINGLLWFFTPIPWYVIFFYSSHMLWLCIVFSFIEWTGDKNPLQSKYRIFGHLGSLILLAIVLGFAKADYAINSMEYTRVQVRDDKENFQLISTLSSGAIVKDLQSKTVSFIPMDKIIIIKSTQKISWLQRIKSFRSIDTVRTIFIECISSIISYFDNIIR